MGNNKIFSKINIQKIFNVFKNKKVIWILLFTLYSIFTFELFNRPFGNVRNIKIAFDDMIPMIKELIIVYHTFAVMIVLIGVLLLIENEKEYKKFVIALFASQTIAYIIYINFQTFVPRYDTNLLGDDIFSNLVKITYSVDNSYSGAPSLHVAHMILSIFYFSKLQYRRASKIFMISYLSLIALTTVLVKQHVVLDIVAGMVHATIIYFLVEYFSNKLIK
ncbi:phosphatase PAP2 family protein [Helcococcus kunzii]|uniref:phosphatase PAP2 family protein n=1 Tax=Helcococcus kunzii TaxID=40091 RepID=UPI0024AE291F|nr:phosphatase PAP2 family protein [Helcococcus kunzii]